MNMLRKEERRKFFRLNAYHLAKYRLVSENNKEELKITSLKDISAGGVCLRTDREIPRGSILQLYINFPQLSSPIPCLAKSTWIKKSDKKGHYEIGLEFLEIEDFLRKEIMERIEGVRRRSG